MGFLDGRLKVRDVLNDFAWNALFSSAWVLAHNEFPVWWLHSSLFEAFEESDLPKAIADLRVSVPFGIIMLPRNRILNPEGNECDWVFFHHLSEGLQLPPIQLGGHTIRNAPIDCNKLRWVTILRSGTTYASTVELVGERLVHGDFEVASGGLIESNQDMSLEQQFQRRIEKLVLQTLLYLQIRPDDLTPPSAAVRVSTKGQGFGGKTAKAERLNPLIVGQQFEPKTERVVNTHPATHASPRTHWRRGHWRRVAIGEGRQQREWRWIQPVLVNG